MNVSASGALVAPAVPVLTGERVLVSFPGILGSWVDAEAVVARVLHARRRGESIRALGLSFEFLDAASRGALERFLSTRVPVPPGARRTFRNVSSII